MKHHIHVHDTATCLFFSFFILLHHLVFSQVPSHQATTMITLSQRLNNPALGWDVTKQPNPCLWKGVTCSKSSLITQLSLSGFALSTSNLPVVCSISSLQSLDLSNNSLSSISEFIKHCGSLDGLKLLNLSKNWLNGDLTNFKSFVGLEFLDLSYNIRLTGKVRSLLDELVNLKSLNLSHNSFEGSIPSNLGESKALEQLVLSLNSFYGEIPKEIADCGNLTLIDLSANNLSGSIPSRIGELAKLEVLILSENNLSGGIPTNLSSISTLWRFAASQNNFSGSIPGGLARYVKNLDLSYNKLSGFIPQDLLSYANLQTVDLSYNLLHGSIPDNISSSLVSLRLGSNSLNGMIPWANFVALDKLNYLELDDNKITGMKLPQLSDCRNLMLLNLAKNKLNGSLPAQLGNLSRLQVMKLQLNNLSGEIPVQFSQLKNLSLLNISWNSLTGTIPASISNLQGLKNLNLEGNHFSGSIPESIVSMNSLIELQLEENRLSGHIPRLPVKLQIALNLSNNFFEGYIPDSLSRLTELEVLDLSKNKFSGEIPEFLTQMPTLLQLNLSYNQLSGIVPKFNSQVLVFINGNLDLRNAIAANISPKKKMPVAVSIITALAVGALAARVITVIVLSISRSFYFARIIRSKFLKENEIHKSNISFTRGMETVANPSNIVLGTKFSTYYKSIMPSGRCYLIKKLNRRDNLFRNDKFDQELQILGKLSHSNVMTPLAYALTKASAYLFNEYAEACTLFDILHGSHGCSMDWESRYGVAIGLAEGLAFLHGCTSGPIFLLDLSSRNIMLHSLKEPQLGDIELCKVIDPSKRIGSLSTVAGSVGYIPPEYAYTMRVTAAGNVYSFGVILLELLTGKPPIREGTELAKLVLHNWEHDDKRDDIFDANINTSSLAIKNQMFAVLEVAIACVSVSPKTRPEMNVVLQMLQNSNT